MTSPADTRVNIIDYVTIASQGEALNFGDMTTSRVFGACSSNSHGGLEVSMTDKYRKV